MENSIRLQENFENQIKSELAGKQTDAQINEYLVAKATAGKQVLRANCVAQTQIYEKSAELTQKLEGRLAHMKQQFEQVNGATQKILDDQERDKAELAIIDGKKQEHESQLAEVSLKHASKLDTVKKFENYIDTKMIKKLYKIFDKQAPYPVYIAEMANCFVSLLRGLSQCTPGDVKLYFEDYTKLKYKLKILKPEEVPEAASSKVADRLLAIHQNFFKEGEAGFNENKEFCHMFAWSQHFCDLCDLARGMELIKKSIQNDENKKAVLMESQQIYEACLEDLQIFELDSLKQEIETIEAYISKDQSQRDKEILAVQEDYAEYEDKFFAQVNTFKSKTISQSRVNQ